VSADEHRDVRRTPPDRHAGGVQRRVRHALSQAIVDADQTLLALATIVGVLAAIVQFLGLIRWPFLVPYLARAVSAPDATPARLETVDAVFQSFNRYLGVAVGEHLGYAWVEDGDGKCIPGKIVGETESASWLAGVPSAHGVHAETDQVERWYLSSASREETSSRP
jgi:hypothetical protein